MMESIKILILEHDPNDLELLRRTLKKSDLNQASMVVETRLQYEDALVNFKPDIILSDFSLPSFDGLTAYSIKSEICPETPFIIVSGTIGEENAVELIKKGITDYALKEKMYQVVPKIERALKELKVLKEKKATEQQLAEQNEQVRNILESITDGFFSVDRDWIVRYYNKEAEQMLVPRDQIVNKNLWEVFSDAVSLNFFKEYNRVMNEGVSALFEEYYPGLDIWVEVNAYPSKDGISVFFRNITERKRQEYINNLEKEVLEAYTRQGSSIDETVQLLLDGIQRIHPDLIFDIQKIDRGKLYHWGYSQLPDAFIKATDGRPIAMGYGSCSAAALLKEKVAVCDISTDPVWEECREMAAQHHLSVSCSYPFRDPHENIYGTLAVYLTTVRLFTAAEQLTIDTARNILQHIFQSHNAEMALKESEEKYKELFHLSPLPMWVYDPETFRFLNVNNAAIRHYEYSREEFLDMTIKDIRPKDAQKELEKTINHTKTTGEYFRGIFDHIKKSGQLIHVAVESSLISFGNIQARLVLAIDITEKIEMERALKLSEQRFKALVQEGSDLISILDHQGNYKYVSPAYFSILGIMPEQLLGRKGFDFVHPDDRERMVNQFELLKGIKRLRTEPYRYRSNDGRYRWIEAIATNLVDDPAIEGFVINSRDITESVTNLKAIETQNKKLREIAWIQSHVVRAPLARIMGLIDLVNNYSTDPEGISELLDHILTSANELDDVIRTIVRRTEQVESLQNEPKSIDRR